MDLSKLTPILLAGGLGSRLQHVISDRPKCLAPINDRPFIYYIFDQLIQIGFKDILIATHHLSSVLTERVGASYKSLSITYIYEPEPLGTGGALKNAASQCKTEYLFCMNADSYLEHDFRKSIASLSISSNYIYIVNILNSSRFGVVEYDENTCIVKNFHEKETNESRIHAPRSINAGIYIICKDDILNVWDSKFSIETYFLPMLTETQNLLCIAAQGKFIDIGIPNDYRKAQSFFT